MPVPDLRGGMLAAATMRAHAGDDPFRLMPVARPTPDGRTILTDARAMLLDALKGVDGATRSRAACSLRAMMGDSSLGRTDRTSDVDAVLASLVAHLGVDPLVAAWLARCSTGDVLDIQRPDGTTAPLSVQVHRTFAAVGATMFHFAPHCTWHSGGMVHASALPDTLLVCSTGLPLREIVSHPALDGHALTVEEATIDASIPIMPLTVIRTVERPIPATIDQLADLGAALHEARA